MSNLINFLFLFVLLILNKINCQEYQNNQNQPNGRTLSRAVRATKSILQDTYLGENQNSSQLVDLMNENKHKEENLLNINNHKDEHTFSVAKNISENSFSVNNEEKLYNSNSHNQNNVLNSNNHDQEKLTNFNNLNDKSLLESKSFDHNNFLVSNNLGQENHLNKQDQDYLNLKKQDLLKSNKLKQDLNFNKQIPENYLISNNQVQENQPGLNNQALLNNELKKVDHNNELLTKNDKDEKLIFVKINPINSSITEDKNLNSSMLNDIKFDNQFNLLDNNDENLDTNSSIYNLKYNTIKTTKTNLTSLADCIFKNYNESLIEISHELTLDQINFLKKLKLKEKNYFNNSLFLYQLDKNDKKKFNNHYHGFNLFNDKTQFLITSIDPFLFFFKIPKNENPEIKYQSKVDSVLKQNISSYIKNFKRKPAATSLANQRQNNDQFNSNFYNTEQSDNPIIIDTAIDADQNNLNDQLDTKQSFTNNKNQNIHKHMSTNQKHITLSTNLFQNQISSNHVSKNRFNTKEIRNNKNLNDKKYQMNIINQNYNKRINKKKLKKTTKKVNQKKNKKKTVFINTEDELKENPSDYSVENKEVPEVNADIFSKDDEDDEENDDEISENVSEEPTEETSEIIEDKLIDNLNEEPNEEEPEITTETNEDDENIYENTFEFGLVSSTHLTNKFAIPNNLIESLLVDKNEEKFITFKFYKTVTKCITLVCVVDSYASLINLEDYKQCMFSCLVNPDGVIGLYATLKINNLKEIIPIKQKFINVLQTTLTKRDLIKGLNSLIKTSKDMKLVLELKNLKLGLTKKKVK